MTNYSDVDFPEWARQAALDAIRDEAEYLAQDCIGTLGFSNTLRVVCPGLGRIEIFRMHNTYCVRVFAPRKREISHFTFIRP